MGVTNHHHLPFFLGNLERRLTLILPVLLLGLDILVHTVKQISAPAVNDQSYFEPL